MAEQPVDPEGDAAYWRARAEIAERKVLTFHEEFVKQGAELDRLRQALTEIQKGEGRFSLDHKQHAINTIEDMKELARAALSAPTERIAEKSNS